MSEQVQGGAQTDPTAIKAFMDSLQRLFKIGIYYPSGHAILDKATERFMRQLAALASDQPSVTLEDHADSLMLEEVKIDREHPFIKEFKGMLSILGVRAITIDREISRNELHDFVRKMLHYRSRVLSARQFSQIEVSEFPHSVTIILKEFLARKDSSITDEDAGESAENLDSFIDSLAEYGLNREEINQCKELLDSLPSRLATSTIDIEELPYASWDDVARLLARAIKAGKKATGGDIRDQVNTHSNINALAAILKKLERESPDKHSRDSIGMLISLIKRPLEFKTEDETDTEEIPARAFPDTPAFTVTQLQQFTDKNKLHLKIITKLPDSPADNETLSILLQLSQHDQPLQTQIRMQQLFREILSGKPGDKTLSLLANGLHLIVQGGNNSRLAATLRLVFEPVRRSQHLSSLHVLLQTVLLCTATEAQRLWPFIVNELLMRGSSDHPDAYKKLCFFAAKTPVDQMSKALPLLQGLESFENTTIAPDIFPGLPARCFSLFAFLMKTEIGTYVGDRVVGGLRRYSPDWLIKAVVPLLDLKNKEHQLFLYSYLRQAGQKNDISPSLKNVAAKIIAQELPGLSENRRTESWVVGTISALGQIKTPEARELLQSIAREKRLLFIPEWPAECRKAAGAALSASS